MSVSLAPNIYPAGARPGSPITIVEKFADQGLNNLSAAVPIPSNAQPLDFIVAWFFSGGNGGITAAGFASDIMTMGIGQPKIGLGTNNISLFLLHYTVRPGDAGTTANLTWSYAGQQASFCLIAYTFRYVDPTAQFHAVGNAWTSAGDGPGQFAGINCVVPSGRDLIFAACGEAQNNFLGTNMQDIAAWYDSQACGGSVPSIASIAGIVDIGYPYVWGGPELIAHGSPTPLGSGVGWSVAMKPVPPPNGPAVTMTPSGSSIDMAGVSGVLPSVSWVHDTSHGQGPQNGWGIARQRHTVGDMVSFWNFDTNTWQASQYVNYGTRTSLTFPAGSWVNDGTNWDLFVFTQESALNLVSALSAAQTFVASPPTATVTVTGPTGTTALPKPAVTWTRSLGSGATQAFYRVKVFTQAQTLAGGFDPNATVPVVDSTKTAGSVLTWTLSKALVPGVYVAYAQLTTNFGQATLWTAGAAFTVAYSQPTAAGVTALVGAGP